MPARFAFLFYIFFASLTVTRTLAQTATPDSIEVKGKAINGFRTANSADITVSRGNQYSIHLCTDTAGNFSFKIPADRSDTNKVVVYLHCVNNLYWTAAGTHSYTIEALSTGINITTTKLWSQITHCGTHVSQYFDPPGKTTFTREQINHLAH